MSKARLVAIVCPSCKGTGKSPSLNWRCMWCAGSRRVTVAKALQFAATSESLGRGGYICGDHDLADMHRMIGDAEAVRKFIEGYGHAVGSPLTSPSGKP